MDDQEKIRYEQIPEAIRDVFRRLEDELIELCFRWKLFRQLYRASDLRIELLNRTLPSFLGNCSRSCSTTSSLGFLGLRMTLRRASIAIWSSSNYCNLISVDCTLMSSRSSSAN